MPVDSPLNEVAEFNPIPAGQFADRIESPEAQALLARIIATPRESQRRPAPKLAPTTWRARGLLAAAALAVAVIAAPVLTPDSRHPPSSRLVALLETTAGTAQAQASAVTAGRYRYLRVRTLGTVVVADSAAAGGPFTVLVPSIEERWLASDGSGGRQRSRPDGRLIFPGSRDRARWLRAGPRTVVRAPSDRKFGPDELSRGDLAGKPTDADALYEAVKAQAQRSSDVPLNAEMLVVIGDWLNDPIATSELRGALYRVATKLDGLELIGPATDAAGRRGTAIGVTSDYSGTRTRQELIFDPHTGEVLGLDEVVLEKTAYEDATPPFVVSATAFLASGTTNSIDTTP